MVAKLGFANRVRVLTTGTPGTGTITLGSASTQNQLFIAALDGLRVEYTILDAGGSAWGTEEAVYTHAGTTLSARAHIESSSGSLISPASGSAVILGLVSRRAKSDYLASQGHIAGLAPIWTSTTAIGAGSGSAHIEGLDAVVDVPTALALTPTKVADTLYYCYLYAPDLATPPVLVSSTVAPATAGYKGSARSASATIGGNAANLHRFLFPYWTNAANTIIAFNAAMGGATVEYVYDPGATNRRRLNGGNATALTTVDLSLAIPPNIATAFFAELIIVSGGTAGDFLKLSIDGALYCAIVGMNVMVNVKTYTWQMWCPLIPATPSVYYHITKTDAGTVAYIDVYGLKFVR